MLISPFPFIRKRLGNQILEVIKITIVLVLGIEIVVRLYYGTKNRTELMAMYGNELAASIYSSIKYPMSVGDQEGLKKTVICGTREDKGCSGRYFPLPPASHSMPSIPSRSHSGGSRSR